MTRNFNRSAIYSFHELTEEQQKQVFEDFSLELSEAEKTMYVKSNFHGKVDALPLSMFLHQGGNNFTHGIFSDSYFSGYFVTLNKSNDEAVVAYKYF
jgi:hypothetical protein